MKKSIELVFSCPKPDHPMSALWYVDGDLYPTIEVAAERLLAEGIEDDAIDEAVIAAYTQPDMSHVTIKFEDGIVHSLTTVPYAT